jgi:coat protein Gp5
MSNSLLTPSVIAAEALRMFENELGFTRKIDKQYSSDFAKTGAKIGNTITVRKPWRPTIRTGAAISIQNVTEESVPLVLSNQKGVDFTFTSQDLTLTIDRFAERYIKPAVVAVANQVDVDNLSMAAQNIYNVVGTSGTPPQGIGATSGALFTYLQAQQKLNELACPQDDDRSFFINPAASPYVVAAMSGLFQDSKAVGEQYMKGMMGKGLGGDWHMAQNIFSYTTGTGGSGSPTMLTTGSAQTGASISVVAWGSTSTAAVGDVFTIAGVYKVNPITKVSTGVLQQFVVTAAATAVAGAITLAISPPITTSGALQTVSAAPATSAAITLVTTANTLTANNILCHRKAFTLGCADMELPEGVHFAARANDEESGLSIRVVRAYDINSDQIPCRLDILYGNAAFRPEWACRVLG